MDVHGGPTRGMDSDTRATRVCKLQKDWRTLADLRLTTEQCWEPSRQRFSCRRRLRRTWKTLGTNTFIYGFYLFVVFTMCIIEIVETTKESNFHSKLRRAAESEPDRRRIRSVPDENEGMYFDSRIHRSLDDRNPVSLSDESPENPVGYPSAEEIHKDLEYSYDPENYDSGLDPGGTADYGPDIDDLTGGYGTIEEMVKKFYRGPVCALVDVRNTPTNLRDLENCTVVNGFVQIIFMHNTKESDFEKYQFPKLRVITEYLLVYRVYGLRSLRKMFPNLAVIKGRQVFDHYGLVIYENPQLQEIGLGNLRHIERGGVRIQKNSKLCYLDTVDWKRLGMLGNDVINEAVGKPVIKDNAISEDETCLDQCGEEGECTDPQTGTEYCWGHKLCQQPTCPENCPNACENGTCGCHEECLGGCTAPKNASACLACHNKYHDGVCVPECPEGTFLENDWRCVTREWCLDFTWVPHNGKCLFQCPLDHRTAEDEHGGFYCEFCGRNCRQDCSDPEYIVSDTQSLKKVYGCVKIPGRLIINILAGDDLVKLLEEHLLFLEEVGALAIRRSESLMSLDFIRNLKRITGEETALVDGTYSLYVLDNQNLRELFPATNSSTNDSLRIDGGKSFFHFNPKLCMKEIDKMRRLTADEEDNKDISETTNGDRATCDMKPLNISDIEHMPMGDTDFAAVRVKWEHVNIDIDHRALIGYQVFYKESKFKNATRFEGLYECGKSSSSWMIKDYLIGPQSGILNENDTVPSAVLHDLKPFTQYALYIRTYTTSSAQKGAQSNITYFTTQPSKPSEPVDLSARALNTSAIRVEWKAPRHPNGNITHYIVRWRQQEEDIELAKIVDMCNQGKTTFAPKSSPSEPPSMAPTKSSAGGRDGGCECSCDSSKILPSHEEEASNNVNFENFLHKSIFRTRYLYYTDTDYLYGEDRKKRSLGNGSDKTENATSETNFTDIDYTDYVTTPMIDDFALPSTNYPRHRYQMNVATDTYFILTDLHHFSEYEIQVFACNHASQQPTNETFESTGRFAFFEATHGCSIDSLTAKRAERSPTEDVIPNGTFRVTAIELAEGKTRSALTWEEPIDPNGYVKSYDIDLQRKQSDGNFQSAPEYHCLSLKKFEDNNRVYAIPTHLAVGLYRGRVRAVTLAGKGEWTEFVALEILDALGGAQKSEQSVWIAAIIAAAVVVALIILTLWCYRKKKKEEARNAMIYSSANPEYISLAANYIPDGYEVDEEDVELIKLIGHGNFGKVYVGFAKKVIKGEDRTEVAIKKLHEKSGIHKRIEFLEEAKLMKAFNSPHVVRLLGVVSQSADPMVVMEYMAKGDLKSHLRSRREEAERETDDWVPPPALQEKLQMAAEIADGMAYLAEIKYVHRDLAARNCLVSSEGVVKIGDFGLTRDVYETDYYRKDSRGLLPIRWMAPESLRDGVFDSQSDVWSYGVVLWEIATLAEQPYQGLQHDEVTRYVIDGGYMERPKNCPKKLYDLMLNCWEFNPEMRPKFTEILASLSNDVTQRFKEESYYFEQKRQKQNDMALNILDKMTEEQISLLNGEAILSREGSFRIVTPLNLTPARSRSATPCSCHTPSSRHSNGSAKIGCDFSPHCDHLKRIDVSAFSAVQPRGISAIKHSASMNVGGPRKPGSLLRKSESFTHRGSRNPSPRPKKTPPSTLSRRGEDMYYSLNTSGIGDELETSAANSEDSSVPQVVARELPIVNHVGRESPMQLQPTTDQQSDDVSYAMLSNFPSGKNNHIGPNGLQPVKNTDADKPYAHMNGFVKRHDSQTKRQNPRRQSNRRGTPVESESSYVESRPQNSSKYSEPNNKLHNHIIDPYTVPPPPPHSDPPPFPPPTHP